VRGGYRRDIDAARWRLADCERRVLRDPRFGTIEYTEWGAGPVMLLSHPLLGGLVHAALMWSGVLPGGRRRLAHWEDGKARELMARDNQHTAV
jgi:hypothetical protein